MENTLLIYTNAGAYTHFIANNRPMRQYACYYWYGQHGTLTSNTTLGQHHLSLFHWPS